MFRRNSPVTRFAVVSASLRAELSLLIFADVALAPLSQALCGGLMKVNLTAVYVIAGMLMVLVAAWAETRPEMKAMEL